MEGLQEFIGMINKALPGAWEATIRQVYIYGILSMIFAAVSGIVSIVMFSKLGGSEDIEDGDSALFIIMIFTAIFCVTLLILGIMYLINPEYHAMQMLKP